MGRRSVMCLGRLAELPPEGLKIEWERRYGEPTPALSPDLLRLGLGHKLQKERFGGISRATQAMLREIARRKGQGDVKLPPHRKLTPGTRLVRDWHGVGYTVVVMDNGFEYGGKRWKSLTGIAKAITGSHWNGPRFFGLTERKK